MITLPFVLQAVLPVYCIALVGAVLRRVNLLGASSDQALLKLIIHFLYPCLILDKLLGNDLVGDPTVVATSVGVGFGIIMIGFALSWGVGRLLGLRGGEGCRSFTLAGGIQNFGYTAVPLVIALFVTNAANDRVLGVLFLHSLGVEIAMWVVGVMLLTGNWKPSARLLCKGPIIAILLGLILVYTGFGSYLPQGNGPLLGVALRSGMSLLGDCAFPLALLLIGATIADLFLSEKIEWKLALGGVLVRNLAMAAVILSCAKYLPLITELKQCLIVQAAMPAAVTPILITKMYGGKPHVAVQVVLATSIVSLITIPFVVTVGIKWVFAP